MNFHHRSMFRSNRQAPMVQPVKTRNRNAGSARTTIWEVDDIHGNHSNAGCGCGPCGCFRSSRKTSLRKNPT